MNIVGAGVLAVAVLAGWGCAAASRGEPEGARGAPQDAGRPLEESQVKLDGEPGDPSAARERAVERARKHLSEKLGIGADDIGVVSAKAVTWPDAALGCPEPDHLYAQVVTDGHEVVLEAQGVKHELHVSRSRVVICKKDKDRDLSS